MIKIASLFMDVDSRRARQARDDLDRLGNQARTTEREVKGSSAAMGSALGGLATSLLAVASAAVSVASAFRAVNQFTEMNNSLLVLSGSQEAASRTLSDLGQIAMRTRAPLESLVTLYQRGSLAAKELGASEQDLLRFTENVALALAQQGGSAASASGALLQLSQALGAGTVRAEEFNSILEGAFPLAMAAARGIDRAGGSVAKLRQLVIEGEISSREFFNAILSQADALEEAFGRTTPTIAQAFQVLGDQMVLAIGQFDQATGASASLAGAIMDLATFINTTAGPAIAFITADMERLEYWAMGAGAAILLMTVRVNTLVTAFRILRGAILATGIFALAVGIGEAIYQFERLSEATGSYAVAFELIMTAVRESWAATLAWMSETFGRFLVEVAAMAHELNQTLKSELLEGVIDKMLAGSDEFLNLFEELGGPAQYERAAQAISAITDRLKEMGEQANTSGEALAAAMAAATSSSAIPGADSGGKRGKKVPIPRPDPGEPNWFDDLADSADRFANRAASAFTSFATGAQSAGEAVKGLLGSLLQMAANQAFTALLGSFGKGGAAGSGLFGAIGSLFANGGAFHGGEVVPFASGGAVVSQPTFFPMSRGRTGMMGEAGPEAIMPLKRGSNGRLGVEAAGGGGTVKIVIEEGPTFAARVRAEADGVAIQRVGQGLREYDRKAAPRTQKRIQNDPRRIG